MPPGGAFVQRGVTWISGADAMPYTWYGHTSRFREPLGAAENGDNSQSPYHPMIFRFPIPYQLNDIPVKVTEIKIYYYTALADVYIDRIELRKSDLAGSYINDAGQAGQAVLDYTQDLGNGSTGNANATILATPLKMTDYPYYLVVTPKKDTAGFDIGQIRIYGFRVAWEATD